MLTKQIILSTTAPFFKIREHLNLARIHDSDTQEIDSISVLQAYIAQDNVVHVAVDKLSSFSQDFNDQIFLPFVASWGEIVGKYMQTSLCPIQNFTAEDSREEKIFLDPGSFIEARTTIFFVKLATDVIETFLRRTIFSNERRDHRIIELFLQLEFALKVC